MKKNIICILFVSLILFTCKDDTESTTNDMEINGLAYANSDESFENANTIIIDALNAVAPIGIVAEVVHSDNAASVGQTLNPTKVILFGNPALGTPLMQKNQLTGLDLPQKMLLFADENDALKVAYNDVSYLAQRHDVGDVRAGSSGKCRLCGFRLSTYQIGRIWQS